MLDFMALGEILELDRFVLRSLEKMECKKRRESWLRDFIFSDFDIPEVHDNDVVFFRSLVRDDYRDSFHAVIEASGVRDPVVIEDYKSRSVPARLNVTASRAMLRRCDLLEQIGESDPLIRSILFIRACMYAYIRDHFGEVRPRAIVFYADMQPTEHMLALHFRQMGVPTVTLQHGLYVDYGSYDTVNKFNYLHQPSEYFLSWGPGTSELISRHHPTTRVVECGKPLIFNADPPAGARAARPYVSLLLDQKPFHTQNEQMIEIVRAFALRKGLDVKVRFHPSLPKAAILEKYPGMSEQLHFTDAELVVGHTSSLLYEALALGCRVLRFASEIPAIALPESNEFTTLRQLEAKSRQPQPGDLWRRYFTAVGEDALKNYGVFFDALLNGPKVKMG